MSLPVYHEHIPFSPQNITSVIRVINCCLLDITNSPLLDDVHHNIYKILYNFHNSEFSVSVDYDNGLAHSLRHSAIVIFYNKFPIRQLYVSNGVIFSKDYWKTLKEEVLFKNLQVNDDSEDERH